jgi:hypothetical protein
MTHLIPRSGGLESRAVAVLNARRKHGHGGIWGVGHEADVVRGLVLLGRLLLGVEKVGGVDGHLGELRNVLLWTQHVGGRTDVHDDSRGVAGGEDGRKKRGRGGHGASTGSVQGALGAGAEEAAGDGDREPSRRGRS